MSKIAVLREKAGMTQRQLADAVNVDPSTIRNWERNRAFVETLVKVSRLCQILDCSVDDLIEPENPLDDNP